MKIKLSIVTTLFQSSLYIAEFHRRASSAARQLVGEDYEIVLVNDGSPDNSLELAIQLTKTDDHVVVVDLSRNFGHHKAMMTGLAYAHGEKIFLLDSDLEEEPEWMVAFSDQMMREQCDVVYGVQETRKGGWLERISGECFYFLLTKITRLAIPANMVTARFMTKRYVDALLMHGEREVFLAGLFHITGFDQRPQFVKKHCTSKTTYTFRRKLALLVNSVTSFSTFPLSAIFYFGMFISMLSGGYIAYLVFRWLIFSNTVSGWTSVMVSIWFLGGLISCSIGVVGIYLSKIFSETKRRPYTLIRKVYGRDGLMQVDKEANRSYVLDGRRV